MKAFTPTAERNTRAVPVPFPGFREQHEPPGSARTQQPAGDPAVGVYRERILTRDHFPIATIRYSPTCSNGQVVLIGSATGVHQPYYGPFACYLAGKGYTVYTFDYRGVGQSRPASLRGFSAFMHQWGRCDLDAVVRHIRQRHDNARITYIGHSIAGQLPALTPESSHFAKVVLVASQHVYWRLWPWQVRLGYALLVRMILPLTSTLFGYYPGRALKLGWDLPKGVALELARWARRAQGMFGTADEQVKRLHMPLLAIGFSDDVIAPLPSLLALLAHYSEATKTHWQVEPQALGVRKVGHFGFFRPGVGKHLWQPVLDWVEQAA